MAARRRLLASFLLLEEMLDDEDICIHYEEEIDASPFLLLQASSFCRNIGVRIHGFAETTVPRYSDPTFRSHFRMWKSTTEILIELLGNCPEVPVLHERGRPPVKVDKQLFITLWYLGNPECIRSISDRFDVTKSSVYRVTRRVCRAIVNNLVPQFIKWPGGEGARDIMASFEEFNGLPRCLGAIDGTHIPIKAPQNHPEQYINRKNFHSMQLQTVCDNEMVFTDVYCGWPGAVHDARVLRNSPLHQAAEFLPNDTFPGESYLIGDCAYPLKTWLITGFKENGNLSGRQRRFNYKLSSKRMVIERCIGLLKGRFRKLRVEMDIDRVEDLPVIIVAACCLHNICLFTGEDIEDFIDPPEQDVNNFQNIFTNPQIASDKREEIMNLVCQ